MYQKSIDSLLKSAASIEARAGAMRGPDQAGEAVELEQEALSMRKAADVLRATEPGDGVGSLTAALAVMQGGVAELARVSDVTAYCVVSIPVSSIGDKDGYLTEHRNHLGGEDSVVVNLFHSKELPPVGERCPHSHAAMLGQLQRLVYDVLFHNQPPATGAAEPDPEG